MGHEDISYKFCQIKANMYLTFFFCNSGALLSPIYEKHSKSCSAWLNATMAVNFI